MTMKEWLRLDREMCGPVWDALMPKTHADFVALICDVSPADCREADMVMKQMRKSARRQRL